MSVQSSSDLVDISCINCHMMMTCKLLRQRCKHSPCREIAMLVILFMIITCNQSPPSTQALKYKSSNVEILIKVFNVVITCACTVWEENKKNNIIETKCSGLSLNCMVFDFFSILTLKISYEWKICSLFFFFFLK